MARGARLPLEQLEPLLLPPAPAPLDFRATFGNDNPVELEVGFGKGLFLLTASGACPGVNFLGVEVERKYALLTAGRLVRHGRTNVRVVAGDARAFLPARVPDGSLQAVHVYFPDPWWKTRHRKRRLFTAEFAAQVERILRPGGRLHFVSDVADYFRSTLTLLAARTRLQALPLPEPKGPEHDMDYLTHFERKYRLEGREIHRALYEKI